VRVSLPIPRNLLKRAGGARIEDEVRPEVHTDLIDYVGKVLKELAAGR
jgi:hypothetical protein